MTSVKHFHSAMTGAPVLNGVAGSLIAVLDACLKDGFGLQTATSVVVASNVATVTFSTGHSFEPDTIALIAGATPAGLNGEKRILTTGANTVTFATTGITDQTATGTITAKLAPAGWERPFSGTNLAAYRSADVESTRMFLRVDDTATQNARVVGYEVMTDVNTGTGPFPTAAQLSGGGWWPKAYPANASARAWTLVADGKGFYLHVYTNTTNLGVSGSIWQFGDFDSYKSGDAYSCVLHCAVSDVTSSSSTVTSAVEFCTTSAQSGIFVPRSYTTLGGSVTMANPPEDGQVGNGSVSGTSTGAGLYPAYPNGPDNGIYLMRKVLVEPSVCRRGRERGLLVAAQTCHTAFSWRDKIDGQGEYAGRKLLAIKCGSPYGNATTSQGVVFLDITGPWG